MNDDFNRFAQDVKQALNGRTGQPILLGVCQFISQRTEMAPWLVRSLALLLLLVFPPFTLIAYLLAGFLLPQTAERSKKIARGLWITIQEKLSGGEVHRNNEHHSP